MSYETRSRELLLPPAVQRAWIELNTYADAHAKCPSCGAAIGRQEAERTTHARQCHELIADVEIATREWQQRQPSKPQQPTEEINGNGEGDAADPRVRTLESPTLTHQK